MLVVCPGILIHLLSIFTYSEGREIWTCHCSKLSCHIIYPKIENTQKLKKSLMIRKVYLLCLAVFVFFYMQLSWDWQVCTGGASDPTELNFRTVMAQMICSRILCFSMALFQNFKKTNKSRAKTEAQIVCFGEFLPHVK